MKVLKFGASWCAGCKIMKPRWEEIEQENPWLETEFIEIDNNPDAMKKYELFTLPTFIYLDKENNEITRFSGEPEKDVLVDAILASKDK